MLDNHHCVFKKLGMTITVLYTALRITKGNNCKIIGMWPLIYCLCLHTCETYMSEQAHQELLLRAITLKEMAYN